MTTYLVDPATVSDLYRLDVTQGGWEEFDAGGVALHADTAREEGWRAEDDIMLTGPDGEPIRARVAVLYQAGLDFPQVLLPKQILAPRMLDAMDSAVYITLDPAAGLGPKEVGVAQESLGLVRHGNGRPWSSSRCPRRIRISRARLLRMAWTSMSRKSLAISGLPQQSQQQYHERV